MQRKRRKGGDPAFWQHLEPGDPVETHAGNHIGEVMWVRDDAVAVKDPVEQREFLIPRDACEPRPFESGRGIRVRSHPVHAAGEGPERFVRHENLGDDWVPEQTSQGRSVTVEGASPTEARRVTERGDELDEDESDVGAAEEERPTEIGR